MKKALTAAMAAITLGGAVCATATTADARPYGHGYGGGYGGHYYRHGNGGAAVAAGVLGLALGAAIASDHHPYYRGGYYAPAYYGPGPGYDYGPYTCYTTRWVWDPYIGRRVPIREAYAC